MTESWLLIFIFGALTIAIMAIDHFMLKVPKDHKFTDEQMKRFKDACCGDNDVK